MAHGTGILSDKASTVLRLIARGYSYDQILALEPRLTYLDIFAAAEEALRLGDADRDPPVNGASVRGRAPTPDNLPYIPPRASFEVPVTIREVRSGVPVVDSGDFDRIDE